MSNTVNFTQLLCKNISDHGKDIIGIFDTMVCEKGKSSFSICIFFTQILNISQGLADKYYYRVVLRRLANTRSEARSYRVDSGVFWGESFDDDRFTIENEKSIHRTTRPGLFGTLNINYEVNFEVAGYYEVDLYVKKLEKDETQSSCEKLSVKELQLVGISPFQVIFNA